MSTASTLNVQPASVAIVGDWALFPSNPGAIRGAIAGALMSAFGSSWNVSPYLRAKPEPPELNVFFGELTYDEAMQGGDQGVQCFIRAVVQWGEDTAAQGALDPLVDWTGSGSLKKALEKDKTLGGVISSLRVADVSEMRIYPTGAGELPGVEFTVDVWPNG